MSRPSSHEPATFPRQRLLALPLVLLCALAYRGSASHFVLVKHRACLVHGELVHEDGVGVEGASEEVPDSFADARLTRTDALESEHFADVHCAHILLRRVLPPPAVPMPSLPAPLPPEPVLGEARECEEPPVAWLHLAPKLSPPRV